MSDFHINSRVRSVLAKNWIDLQKIKFGSFHGTVRFFGELCRLGGSYFATSEASMIESIECEIKRIPGVSRVHFDLSNWRKGPEGGWQCTDQVSGEAPKSSEPSTGESICLEVTLKPKKM